MTNMSGIHEAVLSGDLSKIREIIQSKPSCVNELNNKQELPLHMIYKTRYKKVPENLKFEIVKLLVDKGANLNGQSGDEKETLLHVAIRKNHVNMIALLLQLGADPNVRNANLETALHYVISCQSRGKKVDILKMLLEHKANPSTVDKNNISPLMSAVIKNQFDCLKTLVDAGADLDVDSPDKETALHMSCKYMNFKMIKYIMNHGAKADKYDVNHNNPLHLLALGHSCFCHDVFLHYKVSHIPCWKQNSYYFKKIYKNLWDAENINSVVKVLIEGGIDVNAHGLEGNTALHFAADNTHFCIVQALLKAGANINLKNDCGETPLHKALHHHHYSITKYERIVTAILLLKHGADVNIKNNVGETPFDLAVYYDFKDVIDFHFAQITGIDVSTLKSGKDSVDTMRDEDNKVVRKGSDRIAVAVYLGYEKVVDRLIDLECKSEKNYESENLNSPLHMAFYSGLFNIVKMLLEAGYQIDRFDDYSLMKYVYRKNKKLLCLFWEMMKDSSWKHRLLFNIMSNLIENNDESTRLCHLLCFFYSTIDLKKYNDDPSLNAIKKFFERDEYLYSILLCCKYEKDVMSRDEICEGFFKIDIFRNSLDSLVNFVNNEENLKAFENLLSSFGSKCDENIKIDIEEVGLLILLGCAYTEEEQNEEDEFVGFEDYDNYNSLTKVRVELVIEKRKLLNSARDRFNDIFQDVLKSLKYENMVDEVLWDIFSYFSVRELKKFVNEN